MRNGPRRLPPSSRTTAPTAISLQPCGASRATTARSRASSSCPTPWPTWFAPTARRTVHPPAHRRAELVQPGDVKLDDLYSSWASAFGQTQFIPETYQRLAVDFDGDGNRDLVNSVPDALASTANFLVKAGWRSNEPWGFEVKLPPVTMDRQDASAAPSCRTGRSAASPISTARH